MRMLLGGAIYVLLGASATFAGTIQLKDDVNFKLLTKVNISEDSGANYLEVYAGQIQVKITGGTDPLATPLGPILTFCVETDQTLATNISQVMPLSFGDNSRGGMGAARAAEISQLLARFKPSLYAPVSNDVGAALQIAIWEIVDEGTNALDLSTGTFRVTAPANILALAQSDLNALTSPGPTMTQLFVALSLKHQDLLLQGGGSHIVPAPEPAMFGLFGIGLASLIAARRRIGR